MNTWPRIVLIRDINGLSALNGKQVIRGTWDSGEISTKEGFQRNFLGTSWQGVKGRHLYWDGGGVCAFVFAPEAWYCREE